MCVGCGLGSVNICAEPGFVVDRLRLRPDLDGCGLSGLVDRRKAICRPVVCHGNVACRLGVCCGRYVLDAPCRIEPLDVIDGVGRFGDVCARRGGLGTLVVECRARRLADERTCAGAGRHSTRGCAVSSRSMRRARRVVGCGLICLRGDELAGWCGGVGRDGLRGRGGQCTPLRDSAAKAPDDRCLGHQTA